MQIDHNKLNSLLRELDKRLKGQVSIVAYGGTALTMLGLKEQSKDVDLIVEANKKTREEIQAFLQEQSGVRVDISPGGMIVPFYHLPDDYKSRSVDIPELNRGLKHITFRILDPLDVLVSKIGRFNDTDEDDVQRIIRERKYSLAEIEARFGLFVRGYQRDKQKFMEKFRLFEQMYEEEFGRR